MTNQVHPEGQESTEQYAWKPPGWEPPPMQAAPTVETIHRNELGSTPTAGVESSATVVPAHTPATEKPAPTPETAVANNTNQIKFIDVPTDTCLDRYISETCGLDDWVLEEAWQKDQVDYEEYNKYMTDKKEYEYGEEPFAREVMPRRIDYQLFLMAASTEDRDIMFYLRWYALFIYRCFVFYFLLVPPYVLMGVLMSFVTGLLCLCGCFEELCPDDGYSP